MKVYGLVGKSGTGKSFQAGSLCRARGISSIIDDGLFIEGGRIRAGISAKRQDTRIRSIKIALFKEETHADAVKKAIRDVNPSSLLIIGTSDRMVRLIAERLGLPQPDERIDIESLTTEEERHVAWKQRFEQGRHIIPVPTFQVKKDFSGYFIHPVRSMRGIRDDILEGFNTFTERDIRNPFAERSVVRPTFSYLGRYAISDRAVCDIIRLAAARVAEVASAPLIYVRNRTEGIIIELGVIMAYGCELEDVAHRLQQTVARQVEEMTAMNILAVDVEIQGLAWINAS